MQGDLQMKPNEFGGSGLPEVMDEPLASGVMRPPQKPLGWPWQGFVGGMMIFCGDWRKMEQSNGDRAAASCVSMMDGRATIRFQILP